LKRELDAHLGELDEQLSELDRAISLLRVAFPDPGTASDNLVRLAPVRVERTSRTRR
jgi:hypothetical protein